MNECQWNRKYDNNDHNMLFVLIYYDVDRTDENNYC